MHTHTARTLAHNPPAHLQTCMHTQPHSPNPTPPVRLFAHGIPLPHHVLLKNPLWAGVGVSAVLQCKQAGTHAHIPHTQNLRAHAHEPAPTQKEITHTLPHNLHPPDAHAHTHTRARPHPHLHTQIASPPG